MGENTLPMECSDPAVPAPATSPRLRRRQRRPRQRLPERHVRRARRGRRRRRSTDNEFTGDDADRRRRSSSARAIRTPVLGQPVDGTTITGNRATIAGNTESVPLGPRPRRTRPSADNESLGRAVGLLRGRAAAARGPVRHDGRLRVCTIRTNPPDGSAAGAPAAGPAAARAPSRARPAAAVAKPSLAHAAARHAARGRHARLQGPADRCRTRSRRRSIRSPSASASS